jgi:hypothetical protein
LAALNCWYSAFEWAERKVASTKTLSHLGRLATLVAAIVVLGGLAIAFSAASPTKLEGHSSNLMARITMPDGASRTVVVQGVGCNVSMCSRVAVRSKGEPDARLTALGLHKEVKTWLDSIATITDITSHDAFFAFKDGSSSRRLSIIDGNRFLYFTSLYFDFDKIDVAKVQSVEFLSAGAQ